MVALSEPVPERLVPISEVAVELGRSVRTLRRWQATGLLPPPVRRNSRSYYDINDVRRFALAAERSGLRWRQRREAEFLAALNDESAPTPVTPTPWGEVASRGPDVQRGVQRGRVLDDDPQRVRASWAQLNGDEPPRSTISDLPSSCPSCWRKLVRHGIHDPAGRRWLVASCEQHGEAGRVVWT